MKNAKVVLVLPFSLSILHFSLTPVSLIPAPDQILLERPFRLTEPAEVVVSIEASCAPCSWRERGREAAALRLLVDDRYSQHVLLVQGDRPAEYRVLLGFLPPGAHRLRIEHDPTASAPGAGPPKVHNIGLTRHPLDDANGRALAHAPILHVRPNTIGRFSDAPLVTWCELAPAPHGGFTARYSVVFSHEDGGTPTDRLMATWGRATDIEYVYGVTVGRDGTAGGAEFQGPDHKIQPFDGTREGTHPLLWVVTDNNMVSDRPPTTAPNDTPLMRFAPAPSPFDLDNVSREVVMDDHPWTYRVMADEIAREGRIDNNAKPGSGRIPDLRHYVYVEACGDVRDATLAFAVAAGGESRWYFSDGGLPEFRIARSGCFRAAVPMQGPPNPKELVFLRVEPHVRPSRQGETRPPAAGHVRLRRVNRVFVLDADYAPGPTLFSWAGEVTIRAGSTQTFDVRRP